MDIESARQFSGRRLWVWPADIDATGGWTRRYLPGGTSHRASVAGLLWRLPRRLTGVYIRARYWRDRGRSTCCTYTESERVSTDVHRQYLMINSPLRDCFLAHSPRTPTTITLLQFHILPTQPLLQLRHYILILSVPAAVSCLRYFFLFARILNWFRPNSREIIYK